MLSQPLVCRTPVPIQAWYMAAGFLAEATMSLGGRGHRFRYDRNDARLVAGEDLLALVVAAISHRRQLLYADVQGTHSTQVVPIQQ